MTSLALISDPGVLSQVLILASLLFAFLIVMYDTTIDVAAIDDVLKPTFNEL